MSTPVDNSFGSFSSNSIKWSNIVNSNDIISKFVFTFAVIIAFVVLLKFSLYVATYFLGPSGSPKLITGMVDANKTIIFSQDPNKSGSKTIYRSVNENNGIEFTWSVWIYINNLQTNTDMYKHIFSKGNSDLSSNGIIQPNNAPGLYIAPHTNKLLLLMNTYDEINEEIEIPNIPLNKWINIIIKCVNNTIDVYINGTIVRSLNLLGVPKQNYGDVYVAMNGGFDGYISNLWYYDYAIGTQKIHDLVKSGPKTSYSTAVPDFNPSENTATDYLSLNWFFN